MQRISDLRGTDALLALLDVGAQRGYRPLESAEVERGHAAVMTSWGPLMRR